MITLEKLLGPGLPQLNFNSFGITDIIFSPFFAVHDLLFFSVSQTLLSHFEDIHGVFV
jgi:hypothetical protein